ncbi:Pkinase-domain-containing protein [Ramicandelaber brevisporus]|nr:Pkinase-domain-containing protein [Ramicandelaber brevisporus]
MSSQQAAQQQGSPSQAPSQAQQQLQQVYTVQIRLATSEDIVSLAYRQPSLIGSGSFGSCYKVTIAEPTQGLNLTVGTAVCIKRTLQDRRYKCRELAVLRATAASHPNIVCMYGHFFSMGDRRDDVYLNLVMEYLPENLYRCLRGFGRQRQPVPVILIQLFMYQLFRSLAYIHALGICHRDIKPQNLLVNSGEGVLKLCDFGSAKRLVPGEPNVAYICSRYYRAPELIFGSTNYTTQIDIWSSGCVMGELMLGTPIFPGDSSIDQLVEIIKTLGTPSREQIRALNPAYIDHRFPQINPHPLNRLFRYTPPPGAVELLAKLLDYSPPSRLNAISAMADPFFDDLRNPATTLPDGRPLPPLFDFSELELSIRPDLIHTLVPTHARQALLDRGIDVLNFVPIPPEQFPRPPLE